MTTLKSLVDETTNIKNEIVECHGNLSSILTSKNVELAEDENKLSNLIDKVNELGDAPPPPLYLYKDGVFDEDNQMVKTYNAGGDLYYKEDYLLFDTSVSASNSGIILITNNILDISDYKTLNFEFSVISYGGNGHLYLETQPSKISNPNISTATSAFYQRIASSNISLNTVTKGSCDISNINSGYVTIRVYNGAGVGPTTKVTKIWLEA